MAVENGLAPAEVTVAHDRVQILTVHAAKGLEWQVVAVPHLSGRVFPSTASTRTWLTDAGRPAAAAARRPRHRVGAHGVPVLDTSDVNDRKQLSDKISEHKRQLDQRRVDEERRLLYVALTRAEDTLLLSGHHWGATEAKPRGPVGVPRASSRTSSSRPPTAGAALRRGRALGARSRRRRAEPVARQRRRGGLARRPGGRRAAATCDRGRRAGAPQAMTGGARRDAADGRRRLGRRRRRAARRARPRRAATAGADAARRSCRSAAWSNWAATPRRAAQRLRRRLPARPDPHALLGTAFHDWVQRFYGAERLFDLDDLPGAVDGELAPR